MAITTIVVTDNSTGGIEVIEVSIPASSTNVSLLSITIPSGQSLLFKNSAGTTIGKFGEDGTFYANRYAKL